MQMRFNLIDVSGCQLHLIFNFNSIQIDENSVLFESYEYSNFMQMRYLIPFKFNQISLHLILIFISIKIDENSTLFESFEY
jgi:hypothetical protein